MNQPVEAVERAQMEIHTYERVSRTTAADLIETIHRLRNGNTALLEALMDMVNQFFCRRNEDDFIYPGFVSAEEAAIAVLVEAGMAEEVNGMGYRLLWGNLEARKCSGLNTDRDPGEDNGVETEELK